MPIRFRCAYCNQLMGIARRKAGTVVRCPTCAGQVVVPNPDGAGTEKAPSESEAPLFERSDFEKVFDSAAGAKQLIEAAPSPRRTMPASPPPPVEPPEVPAAPEVKFNRSEPDVAAEQVNPAGPFPAPVQQTSTRPGIWLSPAMATLLSVVAVVALALAFAAGLLVGLHLRATPHEESHHRGIAVIQVS